MKLLSLSLILLMIFANACTADLSTCQKFPANQVDGKGPLPYNYRVIDNRIHAGGHPLNPRNKFKNTDEQVSAILGYLKSQGVKTIIDLENTASIQARYKSLLDKAGIKRVHVPMHSLKTPTEKEWRLIKKLFSGPVYIHCTWGADRTGAVIARYLVEEKNYDPKQAYRAVISGGSHAGSIGGLKRYPNLIKFFWPDTLAVYEGMLPGADCAGLREKLTLYKNNTYLLKDTYIATRDGDKTFIERGNWEWGAGVGGNKLIQLNPHTDKYVNYLVVDDNTIKYIGKLTRPNDDGPPCLLFKK